MRPHLWCSGCIGIASFVLDLLNFLWIIVTTRICMRNYFFLNGIDGCYVLVIEQDDVHTNMML